jgi:hypothetical protein
MNFNFSDYIKKTNYTFKHSITYLDNEIKEHGQFGQKTARRFKDMSTDAFTDNFLADNELRTYFIDYTFHTIKFNLLYNYDSNLNFNASGINNERCINQNIMNLHYNNDKIIPLIKDEKIYILFKGGNVMSMFYKDIMENILNNLNPALTIDDVINDHGNVNRIQNPDGTTMSIKDFFEKNIKKNFKVSDVDYSIYIDTDNYDRFIFLHELVIKNAARTIDEIKNFFNIYYDAIVNGNIDNTLIDLYNFGTFDSDDDPTIGLVTDLKDLINSLKISHDDINAIDLFIEDSLTILNKYKPLNYNFLRNTVNIELCETLLEHIFYIKYYKELYKLNIPMNDLLTMNTILLNRVKILLTNKKAKLIQNEFYTNTKFNDLIAQIVRSYQNKEIMTEPRYELVKENFKQTPVEYKVDEANYLNNPNTPVNQYILPTGKINIIGRHDAISSAKNDMIKQEKIKIIPNLNPTKNIHYSTFNNVIRKQRNVNSSISDFDLMRIKFNINLENYMKKDNIMLPVYKIPSEFIDLSIPNYFDSGRTKLTSEIKHTGSIYTYKINLNGKKFYIDSYNTLQLLEDIIYVLYSQNSYIPWIDVKYEKRIERFIILLIMSMLDLKTDGNYELKNTLNSRFKELLEITDSVYEYIINKTPNYPYTAFKNYLSYENDDIPLLIPTDGDLDNYITYKIENFLDKNKNATIYSLFRTKEKYNLYKNILDNMIFWSRIYNLNDDKILNIINKYRSDYLWEEYDKTDQINGVNILTYNKNKFKKLLETLITSGYITYYVVNKLIPLSVGGKKYKLRNF